MTSSSNETTKLLASDTAIAETVASSSSSFIDTTKIKNDNNNQPNKEASNGNTATTTSATTSSENSITYQNLLSDNPSFRYFWLSYVTNHLGEWLSYLASISLIQEVTFHNNSNNNNDSDGGDDTTDDSDRVNTLVAILIIVKLLPNVFVLPLGGVLADRYDRRKVQIGIDLASSMTVLVFLTAVQYRSIWILYLANLLQETLSGLYIPSNTSIIPLLTSSDKELEKATTLSGLTWSLMAALGSSLGGIFVSLFGIRGCFIIDSLTYILSASFLAFGVTGTYIATEEDKKRDQERRRSSILSIKSGGGGGTTTITTTGPQLLHDENDHEYGTISMEDTNPDENGHNYDDKDDENGGGDNGGSNQFKMFFDGLRFVIVEMPLVGCFALLKGSASSVYGAADVLNVAFSERGSEDNPRLTSLKLGTLFGCVGVGCIIGSAASDQFASLSNPRRIFRLCLIGYVLISVGYFLMGFESITQFFGLVCIARSILSVGSSLIWIDSTLLLQKFSPTPMLGRVQSLDFSAALLGEAISALGGAQLMDNVGLSAERLSLIISLVAIALFVLWSPIALKKFPP